MYSCRELLSTNKLYVGLGKQGRQPTVARTSGRLGGGCFTAAAAINEAIEPKVLNDYFSRGGCYQVTAKL